MCNDDNLTFEELKARWPEGSAQYNYYLSLLLLEQQKRKRAILARELPGYLEPFSSKSTTGPSEESAHPVDQQSGSSEERPDAKWLSTDVLDTFDFEAFLNSDEATPTSVERTRTRGDIQFSEPAQCISDRSSACHDERSSNAASKL